MLEFLVVFGDGSPAHGAEVLVEFKNKETGKRTVDRRHADEEGRASFEYGDTWSPTVWNANHPEAWSIEGSVEALEIEIVLERKEESGPLAWWHKALGITEYQPDRGKGIRIGVIDTGCCRAHDNLGRVVHLGEIGNTVLDPSVKTAEEHGTHVCGIIAAQPASGGLAGIAPGADVYSIRIKRERPGPDATEPELENLVAMMGQNIAEAVNIFTYRIKVDLINMSLSVLDWLSPADSERIFGKAVKEAEEAGILCVAAAGNFGQERVTHPASLPEAIAVSAIGKKGEKPSFHARDYDVAARKKRVSPLGYYLWSSSNFGRKIHCCAPGVEILSTVPVSPVRQAPYGNMTGTSMAAPMVTGALAVWLAEREGEYRSLEGAERARFARDSLNALKYRDLGIDVIYQGAGMVQAGKGG